MQPDIDRIKSVYRTGDAKKALELAEESLTVDAVKLVPQQRLELTLLKSNSLSALGRWEEALKALDTAKDEKQDLTAQVKLKMSRGYLAGTLARYSESRVLLDAAEKQAREARSPALLAEVLWRRGMIAIFAGEYGAAEADLQAALNFACENNDRQLEGLARAGLAKNLLYQKENERAISRFEEALAIFEELGATFYIATVRGDLGTCYLHVGETGRALELLEGSAAAFQANGSRSNYQISLADIGSVYLAQREFVRAIGYYQRALAMARELGDQVSVAKWLGNLGRAYLLMGNAALAKRFEEEAGAIASRLAEERQRAKQIAVGAK